MRSPFVTSYAACSLCTSLRREINREHVGVRRRKRRRRSDDGQEDIVLDLFTLLCIAYWAPLSSAFHWSSCGSLLQSRRRRDVSGPVRLTHLPVSQVCARCRPPVDAAPARHGAHSCRSLRGQNRSVSLDGGETTFNTKCAGNSPETQEPKLIFKKKSLTSFLKLKSSL